MNEVRLAKKGEISRQKEIWKLCFGDDDNYIDFYFTNRYKENETALLLQDGDIAAMLTMLSVKMITQNDDCFSSAMLYAIATHPEYRNKGLATQLMDFSNKHLKSSNIEFSILVPAEKHLFDFYYKQGYRDGFYIREVLLTRNMIGELPIELRDELPNDKLCKCAIYPATPEEYNNRRNNILKGTLYIEYTDEDIRYQKKLSQLSGADIYSIDFKGIKGCVTIERMSSDKVLIKEILVPEEFINVAIKQIAQLLNAKEYIVRTPAFLGKNLGGTICPFGVIRQHGEIHVEISSENLGYIGFAFD